MSRKEKQIDVGGCYTKMVIKSDVFIVRFYNKNRNVALCHQANAIEIKH